MDFGLFDEMKKQLLFLNINLMVGQQSANTDIIISSNILPDILIENNNKIFLNFPGEGMLIFNQYANFEKKLPVFTDGFISFSGNELFLLKQKNLILFNLLTTEMKENEITKPSNN